MHGEGAKPTASVIYFHRLYDGAAPEPDGSGERQAVWAVSILLLRLNQHSIHDLIEDRIEYF